MRTLLYSGALVLLAAVLDAPLAAQRQPPPHPRPAPITPLTSPSDASTRIDLFTADPGPYASRFDERPRDRRWPGYPVYTGPYVPWLVAPMEPRKQDDSGLRIDIHVRPSEAPRERPAPQQAAPAPVSPPGKPKTFYVIPGCYAGDRPPERDELREGCDSRRVKRIPPR